MAAGDDDETLWKAVPEGVAPPGLALRRAFLLEHVRPGEEVLDAGCGEGWLTAELLAAGARPVGIDVDEEPLRRARRREPRLDLRVVPASGPWPLPDNAFDVVWSGEVIEHLAEPAAWLSECRRVLRSAGRLLLSTPDHGALLMLGLAVSSRARDAHFDPRADHLRFYTRRTLTALLADLGFEDVQVRGAGGLPGARRTLLASARRAGFVVTRRAGGPTSAS